MPFCGRRSAVERLLPSDLMCRYSDRVKPPVGLPRQCLSTAYLPLHIGAAKIFLCDETRCRKERRDNAKSHYFVVECCFLVDPSNS